jgi:hypothetical protein
MNPEFDLLLTAYLDDELGHEPRLLVETALRGDPKVAERLAVLGRVRDLVAALPPPEPVPDLSGEVVAFLQTRRRSSFRAAGYAAAMISGLAAAAILIMLRTPTHGPVGDRLATRLPEVRKALPAPPAPPRRAIVSRPIPPTLDMAIREDVLAAEIRERDDRSGLADLLKQDEVRVVDLLVDEVGPASLEALDSVVKSTSRIEHRHARIHVVQGVEIDPSRPGRACAYVLVMDEHEYAKFRKKIDDRFPGSASKPAPMPRDSVASLAKVGRMEFFRDGLPTGTLTRPPAEVLSEVASRAPKREGGDEVFITPRGEFVRPRDFPGKGGGLTNVPVAPEEKRAPGALAAGPPNERLPLVYVLWVSARDRPRG